MVWEAVCAKAFGNQLRTRLKELPLPMPLGQGFDVSSTLISLIPNPYWNLDGKTFKGNGTLFPDIAVFCQHEGGPVFAILDAKYYGYAPARKSLPGIRGIDKQYLYELVFKPFLKAHGITRVMNAILMTTERNELTHEGYVELAMLRALGA